MCNHYCPANSNSHQASKKQARWPFLSAASVSIIRYNDSNYASRVNYYSSADPTVTFNGIATGNELNDNQKVLIQRRFEMAAVGPEDGTCIEITGKTLCLVLGKKLIQWQSWQNGCSWIQISLVRIQSCATFVSLLFCIQQKLTKIKIIRNWIFLSTNFSQVYVYRLCLSLIID